MSEPSPIRPVDQVAKLTATVDQLQEELDSMIRIQALLLFALGALAVLVILEARR